MAAEENDPAYREFPSRRFKDPMEAQAAAIELMKPPGRVDVLSGKVWDHGLTVEHAKQIVAFGRVHHDKTYKDRYIAFAWVVGHGRCKAVFMVKVLPNGDLLLIITAYPLEDENARYR